MSAVKNLSPSNRCPHIVELRSKQGPNPFRALQDCIRARPGGRASIRRDPNEVPHCGACGTAVARPRLYACLACAAVHCHTPESRGDSHAAAHAESMRPGHEIAVDVDRAELFCCRCCDQVYDQDFDAAVVSAAVGNLPTLQSPFPNSRPENIRKRRRIDYRPWNPDLEEKVLIGQNSCLLPPATDSNEGPGVSTNQDSGLGSGFPWGLRGLNNLGSTCFMSSVLQALLHTPPLRNYFLSDKHNRYLCHKSRSNAGGDGGCGTRKSQKGGSGSENPNSLCLVCDLDAIFSAAFSGDRTPYSPARFLYSWWQRAANLATYEQQDAHEFFISILDGIHEKVKDVGKIHSQGSGDCCIAHRVFSGILRSDVMCTACGFTSTTYDPCVDISLDLEPHIPQKKKAASAAPGRPKKTGNTGTDPSTPTKSQDSLSTLTGCLDRFTRPERLGPDQKFFCQQCQIGQESLKQMSIRKLPLVSCFHIKRFEHSSRKNMSKKVDRYLQFPFSLDMAPYLSSSILRARFGNRIFAFDDGEEVIKDEQQGDGLNSTNVEDSCSKFELFAVITHSGKLNAGHYVTYLRLSNEWYKCDDAWITRVSESIVRAAEGYMMFYVQKMLYYRATTNE